MAQPTPYTRQYDFSDYQTVNPSKPLRGSEVDTELDAVKLTTDQLRANIGLIQRDDGKLANQSVTPESLSAGALAMIHQGEYTPRGAWAGTVAYVLGDVVDFNAATYLCIVAHTSTASFAADNAGGKWLLIANGALQGGGQAVDLFVGNGTQTVYTLSFTYNGNNAATVFVAGVAQIPGLDFTIVGNTLTFVAAPPTPAVAGRSNVMVRGTGVEAQLAADLATTQAANASGSATAASTSATSAAASQAAATASQTAAATSATNASNSATSASTSATTATTQATSATNSATAAAASQSAAATSATNAAASATSAGGSATTSTTQATNAAGSATAAANSATAAAGSATTAANQASSATTQASNALTSATNASTSATAAGNSATAAATSATGANNSAISATNSASSATSSASTATTQATNAATSATAAAGSATTATTQASNASTSATAASASETAAASSATSAAASYDSFDDRYLGPKASDPSVDNDGNALIVGAIYFNSVANEMRVWNGTTWQPQAASPDTLTERNFTATAGQTSYTVTGGYRVGYTFVWVNGVLLAAADITATNGTDITFTSALALNDEVRILSFKAVGTVAISDISGLESRIGNAESIGFRNRIINGDMRIDQRNAGAAVTLTGIDLEFPVDRFKFTSNTTASLALQQIADAPQGFVNSIRATVNTAGAVPPAVGVWMEQPIEGLNIADLGWGTANAQTVTVSFWVKSTLTGTFGAALQNSARNRSYPFSYAISVANTWEYKTVTIPGDTTGTWLTTNGTGIFLIHELGLAVSFRGTAGAWAAADNRGVTGAVNVIGTLNATWQITGVQLEAGAVATPFERRPFGAELALCQRYYQESAGEAAYPRVITSSYAGGAYLGDSWGYKVSMRASPTATQVGAWTYQNASSPLNLVSNGTEGFLAYTTSVTANTLSGFFPSDSTGKITFSAEL